MCFSQTMSTRTNFSITRTSNTISNIMKGSKFMTHISCDVKKCVYNSCGGCKLEAIEVGTQNARMTDETKCESFTECESCATNSCGCKNNACECAKITCHAENCKHNSSGECKAKKVDISPCMTGNCGETECDTFTVN